MNDIGAQQTDEILESVEKRLDEIYRQAYKELEQKAADYFAQFERKDKVKQAQVLAGEISKEDYQEWRKNQMLVGKRWTDMRDQMAQDLTNVNQQAAAIVSGELNEIMAINANYSQYLIENGMQMNYGFTMYNRDTIVNLVANDPDIIPWNPAVDVAADKRWNRQMITSHITQGILQGESIPNLSKRLLKTVNNDKVAAVRTARTAVTSSQNAGRQLVYNRAKAMGLKLQKEWMATLDGRTRHDHGAVDGQRVPLDGKFNVGGYKMAHPGDMSAPAHLVYNCRCTMVTVEPEHITKGEEPRKTYDEWIKEKGGKDLERYEKAIAKSNKASASGNGKVKVTGNGIKKISAEKYDAVLAATDDVKKMFSVLGDDDLEIELLTKSVIGNVGGYGFMDSIQLNTTEIGRSIYEIEDVKRLTAHELFHTVQSRTARANGIKIGECTEKMTYSAVAIVAKRHGIKPTELRKMISRAYGSGGMEWSEIGSTAFENWYYHELTGMYRSNELVSETGEELMKIYKENAKRYKKK